MLLDAPAGALPARQRDRPGERAAAGAAAARAQARGRAEAEGARAEHQRGGGGAAAAGQLQPGAGGQRALPVQRHAAGRAAPRRHAALVLVLAPAVAADGARRGALRRAGECQAPLRVLGAPRVVRVWRASRCRGLSCLVLSCPRGLPRRVAAARENAGVPASATAGPARRRVPALRLRSPRRRGGRAACAVDAAAAAAAARRAAARARGGRRAARLRALAGPLCVLRPGAPLPRSAFVSASVAAAIFACGGPVGTRKATL
eukprot:scaffold1300_cov317-Prasinococcus_capsulatus_cf.AAC.17